MRTEIFNISGMTCSGCVSAVTKAVQAIGGVRKVDVSLQAAQAKVEFDEQATSADRLRDAIQRAGYAVGKRAPAPNGGRGCCA